MQTSGYRSPDQPCPPEIGRSFNIVDGAAPKVGSFPLSQGFADELKKAQKVGSFKQYIIGRSSEATFSDAFAKMEAVIRYLSTFDPAGEAQAKLDKMKEEGKPMPKSLAEVQKLMGNTPMDLARSNLAKSGQISRNAFCPCGSKKRYKK
ncbi:hypothetical protein LINPERPRIM_LOCUS29817 [Linum perenne]